MPKRHLLVANPTAHSGSARERIDRAIELFLDRGLDVSFLATEPGGQTVEALRKKLDAEPIDVVVYMGGDGTFAEVAKGILGAERRRPLGMLPSGTANDQGRSFGISSREDALEENIALVEEGHTIDLDVGRIERLDALGNVAASDLFFDSAGWGLQSDVLAVRNRGREFVGKIPVLRDIYRDMAVYVGAALDRYLASWVEPTKFDADIVADGKEYSYRGLTDIIVNATPVYAGLWVLDRDSEPDDGRFELVPIQGRRDWFSKALRDLKSVPIWQDELEALRLTHSEGFSASTFELSFHRPERSSIASQIDGETWQPGDSFRISVLPGLLPLIVRPEFIPPWKRDG